MKARHRYPAGQSSASRLKALWSCLSAAKGEPVASAWLLEMRFTRADVEDETRLFPLEALKLALDAFLVILPDGLEALGPHLVAAENLGVWARVLRGTRAAEEAFVRLDASDSEHGRTVRWETIDSAPGFWHGKVSIGHDPAIERDGHLAQMRSVELAMVPRLFGHPAGVVATRAISDDAQEFDVRWPVSNPTRSAGVAFGVGAAFGGAMVALGPSTIAIASAIVAPIGAGITGLLVARDRARRVDSSAQAMRVSALERSLSLRETHVAAGDLEGNVVAGQYRIGARMGSGASGVIYEATRIADGLPVAVKLLRAATAHDVVASDRLRREAEALGLSWHPNVVEVIEHGHLPDGTSYLVMELLRGETLASHVRKRGRLAVDELYFLALQLADAIVAIHAAGVVHRDLKPSNIYLVPSDAGGETVKVFDFGIARVEWEEMRITNMGAPLGTPGYMSPEQEAGGDIDARSDIFAVGAILYECLIGEPPPSTREGMWTSHSPLLAAPESRTMLPAESGDREVEIPGAWRVIIERALARRREDRFQDGRSLLSAIRALGSAAGAGGVGSGSVGGSGDASSEDVAGATR